MTTYMSTAEHAATIRQELKKKHGWNSRQVSVKSDCYSLGSSIDITIKDARINLSDVEAIADPHESIHRCEITGDILGGANRYVRVSYSHDAMTQRSERYIRVVKDAAAKRENESDNSLIPIEGTKYLLGKTQHGHFSLWSDSFLCQAYSPEEIAREIAVRVRQ